MSSTNWALSAPWIWVPHYLEEDNQPGRYFLFRKTFQWSGTARSDQECLVHVSADSRYRLFVNGRSVSFGPCKSHPGKWYYETVDIRPHLVAGANVISARVLRYSSIVAGSSSIVSSPLPGFMLYSTNEDVPISSDVSWRCREQRSVQIVPHAEWNFLLGPPFMANNERVEEDPVLRGWQDAGYDDSAWESAVVQSNAVKMMPIVSHWQLSPRPIPSLPEIPCGFDGVAKSSGAVPAEDWQALVSSGQPVVIPAGESATVDLSVEELMTAFINLSFSGGLGTRITVLYAECYEKDLGVDTAPFPMPRTKANRADVSGRLYGPRDYYTVTAGQETHSFEPFWFRCFRYVQIEITTIDQPLTLNRISLRETSYPLEIKTKIHAGDELTKIWDISLHTLKNCRHETFEDCPFYEQNQFASDSRLQMLFNYQLSPDDRLARKTMEEFHASRTADGLIIAQYPMGLPLKQIPQFSLYFILMVHDHMRYFGDQTLVRRYLGTVDSILNYFDQRLDSRGLVGQFEPNTWPFVDWVKEWFVPGQIFKSCMPPAYHSDSAGAATINSLLYAMTLLHAADLCTFSGRTDTANEYRARADSLRRAVNQYCIGQRDGLYTDGPGVEQYSQHTQIFAILSETVTGAEAASLMRRCVEQPSSLPQCSYAMKFYVFRAAEKAGVYAEVFHRLLEPWRAMMAENLTTWAEDDVNARSDCHGWSACPVNELVTQVFGVTPGLAGAPRIRIEPRRELVERAEGWLWTPAGEVKVSWGTDGPVEVEAKAWVTVEVVAGGRTDVVELEPGKVVRV